MRKAIENHYELEVYKKAFVVAMKIFEVSKSFPKEELYSLTDQIRRSSRSVCSNLAEAWRKRRYEAAFLSKLNDVEAEAAETQVWLQFAVECRYMKRDPGADLFRACDEVLRMIVAMIHNPTPWLLKNRTPKGRSR